MAAANSAVCLRGIKLISTNPTLLPPIGVSYVMLFQSQVIAGRAVLFLDEPTADLDAPSALALISALKRASRADRLVAITVSSLTFREYAVLDRIQLLSAQGLGHIYFGAGAAALAHFATLQRSPFAGESISDFLLDLVDDEFMPGLLHKDLQKLERAAQRAQQQQHHKQLRPSSSLSQSREGPGKAPSDLTAGRREIQDAEEGGSEEGNESAAAMLRTAAARTAMAFLRWALRLRAQGTACVRGMADCECLESAEERYLQLKLPAVAKQLLFLCWRAMTVRWRDRRRLLSVYIICGVVCPLLFVLVFRQLHLLPDGGTGSDSSSIEGRCLLLSLFPFAALLLLSAEALALEAFEMRLFVFERRRQRRFYWAPLFPLAALVAEVLVVKLPPLLLAASMLFPFTLSDPIALTEPGEGSSAAPRSQVRWENFLKFLCLLALLLLTRLIMVV